MKDLVNYLIQSIVQNPDQVSVTETEKEDGIIVFDLEVAPEDMGRIIGKEGKIIQAIRTLLRAAAYQKGKRVRLNILEEDKEEELVEEKKGSEKPKVEEMEKNDIEIEVEEKEE